MVPHRFWHSLNQSVNPVGFGCWQLSGRYSIGGKPQGWGEISEKSATRLVEAALEKGIQFFDTAQEYGHGRSEIVLGKALKTSARGKHAVICTKISLPGENNRFSDEIFNGKLEISLRNLRRETIDVLLIHSPPDDLDWRDFDPALFEKALRAGKIRSFGVSARSIAGAKNFLECNIGRCLEWSFSLLERRPITELFPTIRKRKIDFIARSPLARGILAEKAMRREKILFPEDDFRSSLSYEWLSWAQRSAKKIKAKTQLDGSLSKFALQFCLSFDEVSAVIPGVRGLVHVEKLAELMKSGPLLVEQIDAVSEAIDLCFPQWA